MKPALFLLLFAAFMCRAEARQEQPEPVAPAPEPAARQQQPEQRQAGEQTGSQPQTVQQADKRQAGAKPQTAQQTDKRQTDARSQTAQQADSRPTAARQQASQPAASACTHCNQSEQLIVDLIYYKQALDILEQIDQQRNNINPELLRSVDDKLIGIRPELRPLLQTRRKPPPAPTPATPPKAPKKPAKPAKKPAKAAPKAPPKQGLDGLVVGHVNDANQELGIKASVVLISNGRPRSLSIGSVIEHNRRKYKIIRVDYVENRNTGNRHDVHLQDQTSKKIHVVPWQ